MTCPVTCEMLSTVPSNSATMRVCMNRRPSSGRFWAMISPGLKLSPSFLEHEVPDLAGSMPSRLTHVDGLHRPGQLGARDHVFGRDDLAELDDHLALQRQDALPPERSQLGDPAAPERMHEPRVTPASSAYLGFSLTEPV